MMCRHRFINCTTLVKDIDNGGGCACMGTGVSEKSLDHPVVEASKETRAPRHDAGPFFDVQKRLGLNLHHWMIIQSAEQLHKIPGQCHAFEKEWIECAHGIGGTRAGKECKMESDDFVECLLRQKTVKHLSDVRRQRDKLIKEGKYIPPLHHLGKEDRRP
ncbi:PREDICTED: NADH dehydrogenase [ubiquinone] iron-sulfur protein 5-like [Odobenus rosmarus divergens]|uniref:NADH dehydrogenase [ubiquinone] iron-sulfur protein 5 n=1 Tax=Odobenus rosmarus divergens TaxID=9708 RepID=A0A9B0GE67_ODORO